MYLSCDAIVSAGHTLAGSNVVSPSERTEGTPGST
jgi:hypothetical protein